jgi:hypothetical protein
MVKRYGMLMLLMGLLVNCATPSLDSPEADEAIAEGLLSELNQLNLDEVERSTLGDGVLLNNDQTLGLYLDASLVRRAFNLNATGFIRLTDCPVGAYRLSGYIDLTRQTDETKGDDALMSLASSPLRVRLGDRVGTKPVQVVILYEKGHYNDPLIWVKVNGRQRGELPREFLSMLGLD